MTSQMRQTSLPFVFGQYLYFDALLRMPKYVELTLPPEPVCPYGRGKPSVKVYARTSDEVVMGFNEYEEL